MGIVELGVDDGRVEAQEPQPQPVVVAVLDDPQVRRGGHHQPGAVGQGAGPQGGRVPVPRRFARRPAGPRRAPAARAGGRGGAAWPRGSRTCRARAPGSRVRATKSRTYRGAMLNVLGISVGQVRRRSPWRMPSTAPARNRSRRSARAAGPSMARSGRRKSSWASVRGWKARATSGGSGAGIGAAARRGDRRAAARPGAASAASARSCQAARSSTEAQVELAEASADIGPGRRIDLRRREQGGERIEVVADADPALGAGLQRRGAAAAERVKDDVAGPRVAGDEGVGEARREARQVRAHGVERVAPEALLVLPLGLQRQRRERDRVAGRGPAMSGRAAAEPRRPRWWAGAEALAEALARGKGLVAARGAEGARGAAMLARTFERVQPQGRSSSRSTNVASASSRSPRLPNQVATFTTSRWRRSAAAGLVMAWTACGKSMTTTRPFHHRRL